MKKLNYLVLFVLGIVLISCGGKNSENKETNIAEVKEAIIKECLISELDHLHDKKNITKVGSKELFTGIAVEKDQSDSIITQIEVKKGWWVRKIVREKVNGKYFNISDYNYENTEISSGYELKISDEDTFLKGFRHIEEYKEYKNAKEYNSWECSINPEINQINYYCFYKEGVYVKNQPSGCMKDYYDEYYSRYMTNGESNEEYNRLLECLKKELPRFDYWTEK